jgi:AraC-like DNA-binding protein
VLNVATELAAMSEFSVVDDPRGARHVVGLRLPDNARHPLHALLALHRGLRQMHGDYGPRSVDLPGRPDGSPHGYTEAFGARVRFQCPVALLRLPAGVLSGPADVPPVERSGLAWKVRHSLTDRLGTRSTALDDVAKSISVHPRTVQRSLLDEGLTFAEILDCVRRERAHALLAGTDRPLAEISARLDFAEPAVLSRCARRWWGHTAAAHRQATDGSARAGSALPGR